MSRVVLITGGSKGIGLACAQHFAKLGDHVAITYNNTKPSGDFFAVKCDVTSQAEVDAIAILSDEKFKNKLPLFGGIDSARFRRQVVPGDTLQMSMTLTKMSARAGKGSGVATVNGEVACECELFFVVVES